MGKAVLDMQAKATSEEIQIPGGTMHYTFDIHALALIAWNPEPVHHYRDTNYLSHRIDDGLGSWRMELLLPTLTSTLLKPKSPPWAPGWPGAITCRQPRSTYRD
eukprot:3382583-Pleurochrysis_carterae.AAC.1